MTLLPMTLLPITVADEVRRWSSFQPNSTFHFSLCKDHLFVAYPQVLFCFVLTHFCRSLLCRLARRPGREPNHQGGHLLQVPGVTAKKLYLATGHPITSWGKATRLCQRVLDISRLALRPGMAKSFMDDWLQMVKPTICTVCQPRTKRCPYPAW